MILGICGVAGSGKDTLAMFLRAHGAVNVAMADPLKRIAKDVYNFTEEQLWGPSAERNKPDTRYPRPHTWVRGEKDATCLCCGQTATLRRVEDDVWVENEDPETDGVKPCYLTPRYALQTLGTEWGRGCYPDTWALKCVRVAKELLEGQPIQAPIIYPIYHEGPRETVTTRGYPLYSPQKGLHDGYQLRADVDRAHIVTISDVRFRNEIAIIRRGGGRVVRVRRPGAGLGGTAGLHPSEAEQVSIPDKEFDYVVENDRGLDELKAKAGELARFFLSPPKDMAVSPSTVVQLFLAATIRSPETLAEPVIKKVQHIEKLVQDMEPLFQKLNRAWSVFHGGRDQGQWAEINEKALPKTKWVFEEIAEGIKNIQPQVEKLLAAVKAAKLDQKVPGAYKKARSIATLLKKPVGDVTKHYPKAESEGYASGSRALAGHVRELGWALQELLKVPDQTRQEEEDKARQEAQQKAQQEAAEKARQEAEKAEKAREKARQEAEEKAEKARKEEEKARKEEEKAREEEGSGGWLPSFSRAFSNLRRFLEQAKDTEGLSLLETLGDKANNVDNFGGARLSMALNKLGDYLKEQGGKEGLRLMDALGMAFDEMADEQARIREERSSWGDDDDDDYERPKKRKSLFWG